MTHLKELQKRNADSIVQAVLAQIGIQTIGFGECRLREFIPFELESNLSSIGEIRCGPAGNKHE